MASDARVVELLEAGRLQRRLCAENGSPSYAIVIDELLSAIGDPARAAEPGAALVLGDERPAIGSALYLRLLGAVRRHLVDHPDEPLAAYWPAEPSTTSLLDGPGVLDGFHGFVSRHQQWIKRGMHLDVQTNEVGRSAALSAGMHEIVRRTRSPVTLLEVGASAGLNLWMDHFHVDAGATSWGPTDAPIVLTDSFVSGAPRPTELEVVERRGCDLRPIDTSRPEDRRLLVCSMWPENVARAQRLRTALDNLPPAPVERSDAVEWIRRELARPRPGTTTIVYHSIVLTYLGEEGRQRFTDELEAAGVRATDDAPLAWLSFEVPDGETMVQLTARIWPGDRQLNLATSRPHGGEVSWDPVEIR